MNEATAYVLAILACFFGLRAVAAFHAGFVAVFTMHGPARLVECLGWLAATGVTLLLLALVSKPQPPASASSCQ